MKVILFGAGRMTEKLMEGSLLSKYDIKAIADNDKKKQGKNIFLNGRSYNVISAEEISLYDFDIILITIEKHSLQIEITNQLISLKISFDKIKALRNGHIENGVKLLDALDFHQYKKTIYYDTTNITQIDYKTGIQRVVKELYRNMCDNGADVCAVQYMRDKFITSREFDCKISGRPFDDIEYNVQVDNGNILLTDSTWDLPGLFELVKKNKNVCVVIYDLIPILNPEVAFYHQRIHFTEWIHNVLSFSSKCICISKSVANDLISYYRENKFIRDNPLEIHSIHLGFDIPDLQAETRETMRNFVKRGATFLIVGTVEPRKNHSLILQSLKKVFKEIPDKKIQLLVLGRDGWMNDDFKQIYESDELIKDRVLWIKDASDNEVQWAYKNCSALLYPPKTEGFGLPLVEAAHFHLPILCSDIPIFHEVVGDNADYFKVDDIDALTKAIIRWIRSDVHPDSAKVKMYTWKECAAEVLDILNDKAEPYAVLS